MGTTKYILPVLAGVLTGMVLILLGENYIHSLYPFPAGIDPSDKSDLAAYIRTLPDKAFVLLIINYAVCSFLAGLVATLVAKRIALRPALVVGIVLTIGGLYDIVYMPQPLWVSLFSMLVYLPFAYFGYLVVRKNASPAGI